MKTVHSIFIGDNRKISDFISRESVDLIVTSPPYYNLKNYGDEVKQIGFGQSYQDYLQSLYDIFSICKEILRPDRRICINVGDITLKDDSMPHKIIPLGADIISILCRLGYGFISDIIWNKVGNSNGRHGHTNVLGSYPYPYKGTVILEYEHIIIAYKPSSDKIQVDKSVQNSSKLSKDEWMTYFNCIWNIPGIKQDDHPAKFPLEIPKRLIKMFSYTGETIFDPFLGSGTTSLAAKTLNRNSIGVELHNGYADIIKRKVYGSDLSNILTPCECNIYKL